MREIGSAVFVRVDGAVGGRADDGHHGVIVRGACGRIRLMKPTGKRIMPAAAGRGACAEIGVAGPPVWSPDGTKIAMPTRSGTYVMDADGRHLRLVTLESGLGTLLHALPAWQPLPKR